jgi:hypothetical protein
MLNADCGIVSIVAKFYDRMPFLASTCLQIRKLSIFIVTPSLERPPTKVNEYHLPGFYIGVDLLLDELPSPWLRSPICPIAPSAP